MKFMLQPNGGLSQGLHPMGDFFDRSPTAGGGIPPDDMFDPLSVRVLRFYVFGNCFFEIVFFFFFFSSTSM